VASAVAATISGLLPVALIVAGGILTERIQVALARAGPRSDLGPVYGAFVLLVGVFLAAQIMVPVQERIRWLLSKRVDELARERAMRGALAGSDMTRLHDADYLLALRRVRGIVFHSATPGGGAAGLIGVFREYLSGFAAAGVLAAFSPWVALGALAVGMFVRLQWRIAVIDIIDVWIQGIPAFNEASYFVEVGLGRAAANEVRLFGLRRWIRDRIHAAGIRGWMPTWRERFQGAAPKLPLHVLSTGGMGIAALLWAASAASRGELTISDLVVFVPAVFATLALGRTFEDDTAVEYGATTIPALETIERQAAATVGGEGTRSFPSPQDSPFIEVRGASFRYPGGEADVLRGVDLEIPAGTSAALVGLNGAGKTTLVRLLCGLYPPHTGEVLVDGIDLREVEPHLWHRRIAAMFQEFVRIEASAADNVAVGAVERLGDDEGVHEAAREAGALRFTERLPEGLSTLLSVRRAEGSDLSGGEWQRLGVARALFALRAGARFLVLDEPTSNLDTASEERLVRQLVDETRGHATTLLVTHRLSLARRTDRIHVVEAGRIVERGSHDELMALGGRYAAAFGMQSSLYPLESSHG
jgi:ATP-binding cassette subfamily B protein